MPSDWTWKPKEAAAAGLLYEPGNWGDLFKAVWIARIVPWLRAEFGLESFRFTDPFAGLPAYPLTPPARARVDKAGLAQQESIRPFLDENLWPSSAAIVAGLIGQDARERMVVSDGDEERRNALAECGRFTVADQADGWAVAAHHGPGAAGLLLIDPYDFMKEWRQRTPALVEAARGCSVLLYIYSRTGPGHLKQYRAFRALIERQLHGHAKLIGRVPADGVLPNAYHELLFLPSSACLAHPSLETLLADLAQVTERLDETIREGAIVER